MSNKYAIWDIDNCLADDKWRAHLIDWDRTGNERYELYNTKMLSDPAHHLAEFLFMHRFTTPVFFTGRCQKWRSHTIRWLREKGYLNAPTQLLFMRGDDDQRSPAELKQAMLLQFIASLGLNGAHDIVAAFDDIPAIVDMYRAHDIPATLLQINDDFSGIYEPRDLAPVSTTA